MRILLTGASGFVGQNLLKYLSNLDIYSMDRNDLGHIRIDLFTDSNMVIHLAGKAHDLKSVSDSQSYYDINFDITKQLYDQFLISQASKFIFISSVKAVADCVTGILDEDITPDPKTHYGKSKLMAEDYIRKQKLPIGKSYYILRPCMIHGPGNKGNLNLLYKFVQKGIPYPLASFDNKRSYLSIDNFCFTIKELIMNDSIPSGTYNLADDDALSTNEVVSILSSKLNSKSRLWFIPIKLVRLLAKLGDLINLPLNTERLNKLTESYIVSNQKLKSALDTSFPVTAREGMGKTALSFRSIDEI